MIGTYWFFWSKPRTTSQCQWRTVTTLSVLEVMSEFGAQPLLIQESLNDQAKVCTLQKSRMRVRAVRCLQYQNLKCQDYTSKQSIFPQLFKFHLFISQTYQSKSWTWCEACCPRPLWLCSFDYPLPSWLISRTLMLVLLSRNWETAFRVWARLMQWNPPRNRCRATHILRSFRREVLQPKGAVQTWRSRIRNPRYKS